MAKYRFTLSIGRAGDKREEIIEVDDADLPDEDGGRDEVLDDLLNSWCDNYIERNWEPIEESQ